MVQTPLVTHYSWETAPEVRLFEHQEEAIAELKNFFEEEVRIDTEEKRRK